MRQVPGRHIAVPIARLPEVEVGPVNLGLGSAGGVKGGTGVAMQEHVGLPEKWKIASAAVDLSC